MFTVQIPRSIIAAASRFMAKNDVRYYLNGVKVEVYANVSYLIATDGHTLAVGRIEREQGCIMEGQGEIIIPREFVEKIKANGNNGLPIVLTVDDAKPDSAPFFTLDDCGAKTSAQSIEGRFPDHRKVIPHNPSGEAAHFNPEYLMRCQKAAHDLGSKIGHFNFAYNGQSAGLATFDANSDFLAVIMPMRSAAAETPAWAAENPESLYRVKSIETAWDMAYEEAADMLLLAD